MTTFAPPDPRHLPAAGTAAPKDRAHRRGPIPATAGARPAALPYPLPTVPGNRSRFAWIGVLIGGAVLYWLVLTTMITTRNPIYFPTMLLLGSAVVPATVLTYAVRGGRRPIEALGPVVLTAIGGGLLGTLAAGTLEYRFAETVGLLPMLAVAVIEEGAKLLIPILVMLVIGARDRRLGVVLGIASGMGFAILETMGYGFAALLASGSIAAADRTLVIRSLLSPACHIAWTGIAMAMIWRIQTARQRDRAVPAAIAAVTGVIVLHALWNSTAPGGVVQWAVGLISLAALVYVLRRARREPVAEPIGHRLPQHWSSSTGAGWRPGS